MTKAVALLSGGLDSMLAICLVKEQGIEIEAVNFQTMFGCCKDDARQVAYDLGVGFTLLKVGNDYLDMIKNPKHGYGRGINPCVDCRAYMFDMAKKLMDHNGASFLISGEVLGQRPMSQKRNDFRKIEEDTGLEGRIVRPLSAKCLPPTIPEKEGILDRAKFHGIQGRSRKQLLVLAHRFGIKEPPAPSSGCALTSPLFAKKVRDIFDHYDDYERWQFEILKMGRHFRLDAETKVVLGRNEEENAYFEYLHPEGTALLTPRNFYGPTCLMMGSRAPVSLEKAGALMLRYARKPLPEACEIGWEFDGRLEILKIASPLSEAMIEPLRIA